MTHYTLVYEINYTLTNVYVIKQRFCLNWGLLQGFTGLAANYDDGIGPTCWF